jgi:hypothetical protein
LNSQDAYDYINCESHDTCVDNMYCFKNEYVNFTVQDCWPCADSNGYTCEDFADALDGDCSVACAEALPTTDGCTSHLDCASGNYCSSYNNAAETAMIVTCNPCTDSWGYSCQDYADAVDGSCDSCAGNERNEIPSPSDTGSGGGSSENVACRDPAASKAPVAHQGCTGHADCSRGDYCSAYMGSAGCVIDCWPCSDIYSMGCSDYGDSIDGSCNTCDPSSAGSPAAATTCRIHNEVCEWNGRRGVPVIIILLLLLLTLTLKIKIIMILITTIHTTK